MNTFTLLLFMLITYDIPITAHVSGGLGFRVQGLWFRV